MIREDSLKKIEEKQQLYSQQLQEEKRSEGTITLLRAITFIAGFCLVAIGIGDEKDALWIVGVALLVAFVVLIRCHNKLDMKVKRLSARRDTCERIIASFQDKWNDISDSGEEFIGDEDYFAKDVDMLGFNSLYQKINLAHTPKGRSRLATLFSLRESDVKERDVRQEAIMELMEDEDFIIDYSASTSLLNNKKAKSDSIDEFAKYCGDKSKGTLPGWAKVIRFIFPALFWVAFILWLCGVTHYGFAIIAFFVNLSITILTRHITDGVIQPLYVMCLLFEGYMDVLETVKTKEFKSKKLAQLYQSLCGNKGSYQAFKALKGISQAYNIMFNPVLHQVLSALFFWDYQLAVAVSSWKKKYGENIAGCFDNIGELEVLVSLSLVGVIHQCSWGELTYDDNVSLNVVDAYHPLIDQTKVVSNSASIESGITIITGSNMSGKTTFLRTLAINLALLYMGAPICAKEFKSSYMKIFTSMRVTDDVAHGISTFYAEILRIKTMSEYKAKNQPMLCLIDEIFKGTNSADRIVGAKEVITGLSAPNTMVMVSTHDFELCALTNEDGSQVSNYHFEEYYEDDQLKFDYKIKDGRCTTTNARAILKMAGFDIENKG
ncbi:MAG: DNA mismatch repair protein MutS [Lachnospiraceae bacterium]|nr:DNA mismatch repair protein MutS [Lachnospiraceae bacterium]